MERCHACIKAHPNSGPSVGPLKKWLKAETWLFPPLFVAQVAAFAYAISFASAGPRSAVVLAPMAVLGLLFVPISFIATVNLSLGEQGLDVVHLSKDAFLGLLYWGVSISVPHGAFMMELFRISTDLSERAKAYPSRNAVWIIVIVELVVFLYVAYRLDDRAAAFKVKRVEAPLVEVLEADRQADQFLPDAGRGEIFRTHLLVGGGTRVDDQSLGVTDVG